MPAYVPHSHCYTRRSLSSHRARSRSCVALTALALSLAPFTLPAQPTADTLRLSLAAARAAALRANPELVAVRLDTAVARGELRQAGILRFNPAADVLAAGGGNGREVAISQEVEVFGQRGSRLRVGGAGLDRARFGIANAARLVIGDVDRTYYRLVSSTRRTGLADEILALNERLADVARRQLAAGEISRLDYNLTAVDLGRSRSRAMAARREREHLSIELGRLLGLAAGTAITPVFDSTPHPPASDSLVAPLSDVISLTRHATSLDVDSLMGSAMKQRPDLAEQAAAVRQATAQASLARRDALPNLVLRGTAEPRANGSGRVVRPGIGITLPVFNRNQGEFQARRAAARQAELEQSATVRRVQAEITSAVTAYRSASMEVEVLETTVLALARQNRQLLETAYREGEVGLPVLLLIRNQVIDAELDYWTAWLAEREALAALSEATGANLRAISTGGEQ